MEKGNKIDVPPIFDSTSTFESGEFILSNDSFFIKISTILNSVIPTIYEYGVTFDQPTNKLNINFEGEIPPLEIERIKEQVLDSFEKNEIRVLVDINASLAK